MSLKSFLLFKKKNLTDPKWDTMIIFTKYFWFICCFQKKIIFYFVWIHRMHGYFFTNSNYLDHANQSNLVLNIACQPELILSPSKEQNRRGRHPVATRRMVALYDYDPRESSPNVDVEVLNALPYMYLCTIRFSVCWKRMSVELLIMCFLWQAELTFCAGDIIAVFGDIDEDGFYYVSLIVVLTAHAALFWAMQHYCVLFFCLSGWA